MIPSKQLQPILEKVAKDRDLPIEVITVAYRSMWEHMLFRIKELPHLHEVSEEEFKQLRTSFNIPSIGKFYTSWERIEKLKEQYEKNNSEESKTNG